MTPRCGASLTGIAHTFPFFRAPQVWLNEVSNSLLPPWSCWHLSPFSGLPLLASTPLPPRRLLCPVPLSPVLSAPCFCCAPPRPTTAQYTLRPLVLQSTAGLALVGLLPFGLVGNGFWAPGCSAWSSAQWVTAGHYAQWLAIMLFFKFINVPSVQAIPILGLQGKLLVYEITIVTLRLASLAAGVLLLESDVAAIA